MGNPDCRECGERAPRHADSCSRHREPTEPAPTVRRLAERLGDALSDLEIPERIASLRWLIDDLTAALAEEENGER